MKLIHQPLQPMYRPLSIVGINKTLFASSQHSNPTDSIQDKYNYSISEGTTSRRAQWNPKARQTPMGQHKFTDTPTSGEDLRSSAT